MQAPSQPRITGVAGLTLHHVLAPPILWPGVLAGLPWQADVRPHFHHSITSRCGCSAGVHLQCASLLLLRFEGCAVTLHRNPVSAEGFQGRRGSFAASDPFFCAMLFKKGKTL